MHVDRLALLYADADNRPTFITYQTADLRRAVGKLLVANQVVLILKLPFALYKLLRMTNDRALMSSFANATRLVVQTVADWIA